MNGTAQTTHRKVTEALDVRLTNLEMVIVALDAQLAEVAAGLSEEHRQRLTRAVEQHAYINQRDETIDRMIRGLRDRGFWARWRWLVRGTS